MNIITHVFQAFTINAITWTHEMPTRPEWKVTMKVDRHSTHGLILGLIKSLIKFQMI